MGHFGASRGSGWVRGGVLGLCAGAMWGLSGCGASDAPPRLTVYEVKGTILKKDGKPLSGGHVYLVPADGALTPEGPIGPDGTFSVVTATSGEGAPVGDYKVRVEPPDATALAANPRVRNGSRLPFPAKYLDEDTSGLHVRVEPRANVLDPIRLQ